MKATLNISSEKPQPNPAGASQSRCVPISWLETMYLPTLRQVRLRSVGCGLIDRWSEPKTLETGSEFRLVG